MSIIQFPGKNPGERMLEVCDEAAHLIEDECVRQSQAYVENPVLSLTDVSEDALQQMAAWSLARLAEIDATRAIKFSDGFSEWARSEWFG
jgi:hypothetical protein